MARKKIAISIPERIRQIVERWFLTEPLLFSIWTTHALVIEPRIRTIRVRRTRIEYNPAFLEPLDDSALEEVLRCEAMRILLKHPYQRRKENGQLAYQASNITLQEYLRTNLPLPSASDIFGTEEHNRKYFEYYYHQLQNLADNEGSGSSQSSGLPNSGSNAPNNSGAESSAPPPENNEPPQEQGNEDSETSGGDSEEQSQTEENAGQDDIEDDSTQSDEQKAESQPDNSSSSQPPPQPPLEEYSDADASGDENTEDWDSDELTSDRINNVIRTAHETNQWGSVAGRLREQVLASLRPKLDYRTILRQFRTTILSSNRALTRMKPSRRYGFAYMGSRYDFTTNLLFAIDVSGSIGSDDLRRGFSVINRFFKYGVQTIDVIQFDAEIYGNPTTLKRARTEVNAVGRGGTDFVPVMAYIDKHRSYDGLIIFTDGIAPVPPAPNNKRTRVLWLFNNESTYERIAPRLAHIGKAVFLKEDA